MKDQDQFLKKMENLNVPDVNPSSHQHTVKMAIMSAARSATLGIWLVTVPCCFLLGVLIYYFFHINLGWFGAMFNSLLSLDIIPYADFWAPVIFFLLPIICIIINALSIMHVQYQKMGADQYKFNELNITIKLRFWNILLILLSLAVIGVFMGFTMTENISVRG